MDKVELRSQHPTKQSENTASTSLTVVTHHASHSLPSASTRATSNYSNLSGSVSSFSKSRLLHTPFQKLTDAFITILAGAHGLAEINTRLRSDEALQRAFGRTGCAEQSVVQETLSACTPLNIQQMQIAMHEIFRTYARAFQHNYKEALQLLDIDLSGMPCGAQQEPSTLGYFGEAGIRYGRQLGRVIATHYEEVITDQLFAGNVNLFVALPSLVAAAEATLELDDERRPTH